MLRVISQTTTAGLYLSVYVAAPGCVALAVSNVGARTRTGGYTLRVSDGREPVRHTTPLVANGADCYRLGALESGHYCIAAGWDDGEDNESQLEFILIDPPPVALATGSDEDA